MSTYSSSMVSKYRCAFMAIPKKLLNMLIFIGGITLEVYLLHEEIIMNSMRLYMHPRYANTLSIFIAILGAWMLKEFVSLLLVKLSEK